MARETARKKGGGWRTLGGLLGPVPPRVDTGDIAIFTRQLSTMLSAGVPLMEALDILAEQQADPGFSRVLDEVVDHLRGGGKFSGALDDYPKLFSDIYVSMIEAGEASGDLDAILQRLAEYMEESEQLKREIKSAMTYPVIALGLIVSITIGLLYFVVPSFQEIFNDLGVELPMITQWVLALSSFIESNILLLLGGMVAAGIAFYFLIRTGPGEKAWHYVLLRIPIFGPLFEKLAIARFTQTYATLIRSGVPILGALEITAGTAGNRIIEEAVLSAREDVRQGEQLGEPLEETGAFPLMVTKMITIGEKAGALEELLDKIAEFYNQQVKATVEQLTSLIEPILIAVMGFLVGGIVLAIFLPILRIQEALQQ